MGDVGGASYLFGEEHTVVTSFKEVSGKLSSASQLNVASVEQIRRKRSARLKGMAFLVCKG